MNRENDKNQGKKKTVSDIQMLTPEKIKWYLQEVPAKLEKRFQEELRLIIESYVQLQNDSGNEYNQLYQEFIKTHSMPGKGFDQVSTGTFSEENDRMERILEESQRDLKEYRLSLLAKAEEIQRKLAEVRRFMIVFSTVDYQWRGWLTRLYMEHELWRVVEQDSGLSHNKFLAERKRVITEIEDLYNSALTNVEIAKWVR